jgi:sec-independent protein translocase protein TatA
MGPIGFQELVLILIIALLVFGPKKLPELGRSLGKTLAEFRRASNDIKQSIERELEEKPEDSQQQNAKTQ